MEQFEHPILLVEDNPDDVLITKRAFSKGKIKNKLYIVNNGIEALKFLNREEDYENVPIPSLIMLDINMPMMNGFEVLKEIKKNDKLKRIPIIMLTTSERDKDIDMAYSLGANNYIVKPVSFQKFIDVVVSVQEYWLQISKIPTN
jgi:CheY-like chemotaxis protein